MLQRIFPVYILDALNHFGYGPTNYNATGEPRPTNVKNYVYPQIQGILRVEDELPRPSEKRDEAKWENDLYWARLHCIKYGLMASDGPKTGRMRPNDWRISPLGLEVANRVGLLDPDPLRNAERFYGVLRDLDVEFEPSGDFVAPDSPRLLVVTLTDDGDAERLVAAIELLKGVKAVDSDL